MSTAVEKNAVDSEPGLRVGSRNGEFHVVSTVAYRSGEEIMLLEGELVSQSCRYSVQIGRDVHIGPPPRVTREAGHDRYLWRFLNHSCKPNAKVVGRVLLAIRAISSGEEITFDYNANEYDMAAPFRCHCGHCQGDQIRGFRYLSSSERQQRRQYLADHLLDRFDEDSV